MKILLTSRNSSLYNELFLNLSEKNEVFFTSRNLKQKLKQEHNYIPWNQINKYDFDFIIAIDGPKIKNLESNFFKNLLITVFNASKVNRFMRTNKKCKIIIFSTISIFNTQEIRLTNKLNIFSYSKYSFSKIIQEKIISFRVSAERIHIMRLPAILNRYPSQHLVKRVSDQLKLDKEIYLYSPESKWNACLAISDLKRLIGYLLDKKFISGMSFPHAESPMPIEDVVKMLKMILNSNSKIIKVNAKVSKNPRLILTKNIIPNLSVNDSIKEFNSLQKED